MSTTPHNPGRLAALARRVLDVPSRTEHAALRHRCAEMSMLWSLYALEREHAAAPPLPGHEQPHYEAMFDLDRALEAHGQLRPLVPLEPAPAPAGPPPGFVALCIAAALAALFAGLLSMRPGGGCTIRGGAECAGGCPPREVCRADRCVPAADLRPVPSMGGPL